MNIFLETAIAILICAAVFFIVTAVSRATSYPRRSGERVAAVVRGKKDSESLEHTVRTLIKARDVCGLDMQIAIPRDGLTAECVKAAEILSRNYDGVCVLSEDELLMLMSEL